VAAISSHICDGSKGVTHYFRERYQAREFILNIPFKNNPENLEYIVKQFQALLDFIENYTQKKILPEKIQEALELSNAARAYWIKAFNLRKGIPLFPGYLSLRNLFGATFLFGSQLGLDVAKAYYEQLLEFSQKQGAEHKKDKKRLLWIHFAPLYNNKMMEYLEKELDCWIVMDITGYIYWDKYNLAEPFVSLARRTLAHFYLGEPEDRSNLYRRLIKDYAIDGVVHFMHLGCRAIPGSSALVRNTAQAMNVPFLELVGDCIDPRGFSEQQMRIRLEAFKETLWR
jgi:benzoyl-CoA reductase/2-hydroxyglutaryl-CoA dehydratase subunit BcrC/BadD/HgdB